MSSKQEERRKGVRISYPGPLSYMAMGLAGRIPNQEILLGEIVDLSKGGMRIRTGRQTLEEGTVVRAEIPVSEPSITVPVLSQVLWIREEKPGNYQVGLRFVL